MVGPNGLINAHRKLHAFENSAIIPGNKYNIYDIHGWEASILICYDNQLVENNRIVAILGTKILFAPHQTGSFDFPAAGMGIIPREL